MFSSFPNLSYLVIGMVAAKLLYKLSVFPFAKKRVGSSLNGARKKRMQIKLKVRFW